MSTSWNRTLLIDASIALILGLATAITTIPAVDGDDSGAFLNPAGFAVIGATAMCLTFRRHWPIPTLLAVFAGTGLYTVLGYPYGPIFILMAVAMGSVAAFCSTRTSVILCAVMIVAHLPYSLIADSDDDSPLVNIAISVTWLVLSAVTGLAFKQARESRVRAKEEEHRRFLSEERLSMAREVHDVLGHSLAVISMHAGVALHVLGREKTSVPPEVIQSLQTIRDSGTDALDELRATLAPVSDRTDSARTPAPGMADVGDLVATLRNDGLRVQLDIAGTAQRVPTAVDSAAYRVTQESLTNVVKHSGASRAEVHIGYLPGRVSITVNDNGRGASEVSAGHGLLGMRERVEALGGTFAAGPGIDGGFTVNAELPYAKVDA